MDGSSKLSPSNANRWMKKGTSQPKPDHIAVLLRQGDGYLWRRVLYSRERGRTRGRLSVRRILMGAVGTMILAAVVTVGAIATSAPKHGTAKGGWRGGSADSSVSTSASPSQAAPSQEGDFDKTLHLILRQQNAVFLDTNPQGPRGDQLVVEGPVLKPHTNDTIGLFSVRCQLVAPGQFLFDCNITFNLHGTFPNVDSITVQGGASDATTWTNAVTGGSGRYANVTGEVRFHNIGTSVDVDALFHLNHVR